MIAIRIICKMINPPAKVQTGIFNLFIETPPQQIYECNAVAVENAMRNHSRLHFTDTHSGRMINRQVTFPRFLVLETRIGLLAPIEKREAHWLPLLHWYEEARMSTARDWVRRDAVYLNGREPAMRMSTSLLALCCQSAPEPTCETPISARSKSDASRSLRRSPLLLARFTSPSIASWIMVRDPS